MAVAERHRKFSVEEFYRMAEAGIFHEDDRVELLDGEIVEMTPIGNRHAACVARLVETLGERSRCRAIVWVQNPLRLSLHTELQPDLALLERRVDFYASGHPEPRNVFVAIEVADTSLAYDRGLKAAAYAWAGVAELWIIDLSAGEVLVRRDPLGDVYRFEETRRRGERLEVTSLPDVALDVDDVLPD